MHVYTFGKHHMIRSFWWPSLSHRLTWNTRDEINRTHDRGGFPPSVKTVRSAIFRVALNSCGWNLVLGFKVSWPVWEHWHWFVCSIFPRTHKLYACSLLSAMPLSKHWCNAMMLHAVWSYSTRLCGCLRIDFQIRRSVGSFFCIDAITGQHRLHCT